MLYRIPTALGLLVMIAILGFTPTRAETAQRVAFADSCSVKALARAAAADTTRLRRVAWDSAPGKSAEGGQTTVFYDGIQPRVILITYYGETSRTVARYYLAAPDQYIVEQETVEYAEPIGVKAHPVLKSRRPSTIYVCGQQAQDGVEPNEFALVRTDLKSVLDHLIRR